MILPVGTLCHVKSQVSTDTIKMNGYFRDKGYALKCPASYRPRDTLIVKSKLTDDLAMVCLELHPTLLSVICWKDLEKE